MVEVILDMSIDELSNDLYSSINWSRVGLKTFKQFKNSVFKEFEERELRLSLKYEKVTPFANQDIEIEYINEVQFVGEEEEFNLESFDIFGSEDVVEDNSPSLEGLSVIPSVYESLSFEVNSDGFDYYGEDLESEELESEGLESKELESQDLEYIEEDSEDSEKVDSSQIDIPKDIFDLLSEEKDYSTQSNRGMVGTSRVSVDTGVTSQNIVVSKRNKEVVYHNGMSLRQFLRENPRSTMDVAETYFSRKDIMREIQLGRVIKRGQKLFI